MRDQIFFTEIMKENNKNLRPINSNDYKILLELDKKVYPTDTPVTHEILDSWYLNNPEFGIVFEDTSGLNGMCIAIPLTRDGWSRLVSGELTESDLGSDTIFYNMRDSELGIIIGVKLFPYPTRSLISIKIDRIPFIERIGRLVDPAPLPTGIALNLCQRIPESQSTVSYSQTKSDGKPTAFEIQKQKERGQSLNSE
jgi:hypothetical protein